MPVLTAIRFDADAAGLLLVAEVEAYLRTTPASSATTARKAGGLDLQQLLDQAARLHRPTTGGSVVRAWHHPHPLPAPTLTDRLLGRRAVADVTVEQHLQLTAAYIHRHGWTQGRLWDDTGSVCVLGAQLQVLAHGFGTAATATRARQRIGNALGRLGHPIPIDLWNDQPSTRQTDVHHLLHAAASHP